MNAHIPQDEMERATLAAYGATAAAYASFDDRMTATSFLWHWRYALPEHPVVADIGCGFGGAMEAFGELGIRHPIGVDPCPELVAIARFRYPKNDFRIGNVLNLASVVTERCDGFVAAFSLAHIRRHNIEAALTSIRRILKPEASGIIIGSSGTGDRILTSADNPLIPSEHRMLVTDWTLETLTPHLAACGFALQLGSEEDGETFWARIARV
ncbi:MAG: class I SAM-dependent methyltransferase [bacterium]